MITEYDDYRFLVRGLDYRGYCVCTVRNVDCGPLTMVAYGPPVLPRPVMYFSPGDDEDVARSVALGLAVVLPRLVFGRSGEDPHPVWVAADPAAYY